MHTEPPSTSLTLEPAIFAQPLAEVEALSRDIKKLVSGSDSALEHQNIRTEMETLERWLESYRRGLSAANKLSLNGPELLQSIRNRLKLAVEEIQRLEGEGGNPATEEKNAAEVEELLKTSRKLEQLIPAIEQMFCKCNAETEIKATPVGEFA